MGAGVIVETIGKLAVLAWRDGQILRSVLVGEALFRMALTEIDIDPSSCAFKDITTSAGVVRMVRCRTIASSEIRQIIGERDITTP